MTENRSVLAAARAAREASRALGGLSAETRNLALLAMAAAVNRRRDEILVENQKDVRAADALIQAGELTRAAAKRLQLGGGKIDGVIESLRSVAELPDPLGEIQTATELDAGLHLYRVSCPIGVIAMIFESRPDALPQIASLCLKSGNAVLLKGGSEALNSNRALARVLDEAARSVRGIPKGWMTLLETREEIAEVLDLDEYVDLIIPRGSNEFVRHIMDNTKIPVTGHRDGICHTYVHAAADPHKAVRIVVDGKTQYPAVCNATETLLIDRAVAATLLPAITNALKEKNVELRLDGEARAILPDYPDAAPADEETWSTEHLDLILGVRVVKGIDQAIDHVNRYGSHHTDAIVTEDARAAARFMSRVDSASVMHNASTRFADGYRYGLGAEVGISTEKIHSRGPVGLEGLTIYKYLLQGSGQIVADYSGPNARKFIHKPLPVGQS
ncbi:MAG TPA: glutamate-5-semialdehyde dehydrogenase [Sumerlaeia bacterium]|nr:glutamate-5-semialdehyde dehydrogenase [Sumerlaeia bacterium]